MKAFETKVVDARHQLTVKVNDADIFGAICRDHQKCALARAIMRETGAEWVDVGAKVVLIARTKKGPAERYVLTPMGQKQVRYFDTHKGAFAPCEVSLSSPPPSYRLGAETRTRRPHGNDTGERKRRKPTR